MKTKTLLEYLTLSSSIYVLARDTKLLEKLQEYSEKSKDNIKLLSKYSEYLLIMSELFLDDMFHHILRTRDKYLINNYFTYLSNKNKLNLDY